MVNMVINKNKCIVLEGNNALISISNQFDLVLNMYSCHLRMAQQDYIQ